MDQCTNSVIFSGTAGIITDPLVLQMHCCRTAHRFHIPCTKLTSCNDWIVWMSFPTNSIFRPGQTDSGLKGILPGSVEHHILFSVPKHMARAHSLFFQYTVVLFQNRLGIGFFPVFTVTTDCIANCQRFLYISCGIPHFEEVFLFIPDDTGIADRISLPQKIRL